MLQAAKTDLFNPLVPKAHNSECQNLLFLFQIKPVKVNLKLIGGFLMFSPSALVALLPLQFCSLLRPETETIKIKLKLNKLILC